ncbi:MAG TPA: RNA methyltransferase [Polyangia bacterium]
MLSVALVHHPVYDKHKKVVATALTNLDLHDIARSSRTYGVERFFIVHPVAAQRELAARIAAHWQGDEGAAKNDFRRQAIDLLQVVPDLPAAVAALAAAHGRPPLVCATAARESGGGTPVTFRAFAATSRERPALLVLGTGWGLTDEILAGCDVRLPPIRGVGDYNHLSVRSACAIILDRLYGDRED